MWWFLLLITIGLAIAALVLALSRTKTGPTGPQGLNGPQGVNGTIGPQGIAGAVGPQGPVNATQTTRLTFGTGPINTQPNVLDFYTMGCDNAFSFAPVGQHYFAVPFTGTISNLAFSSFVVQQEGSTAELTVGPSVFVNNNNNSSYPNDGTASVVPTQHVEFSTFDSFVFPAPSGALMQYASINDGAAPMNVNAGDIINVYVYGQLVAGSGIQSYTATASFDYTH